MTEEKEKKHPFRKMILFLILLIGLFYCYIHFIEPNLLTVKEYAIVDNQLPYSFHGLKIVHFSDVLYGSSQNEKKLEKIVAKINELNPDIVLYTGDLFNSGLYINEEAQNNLIEIFKKIQAKLKKYAVIGDNDSTDKIHYIHILESAGFTILNNKNDALYYGGTEPLLFIGTNSLLENEYNIEEALTNTEDISSYYKIWLSHEPSILDQLENYSMKPNLIFAGHTLGGLIQFPFGYTLLNQEGTNGYTKDFYEKDQMKMYISSGLGTYRYPVRFLNEPSISFYRLYQY